MKKKTMTEARNSHLAMQKRRDALAALRLGKTTVIHLVGGEVVRVRPLTKNEDPCYKKVLVLINNRLVADYCSDKDGWRVRSRHFRL